MQIYMQILIDRTLMDQRYGCCWQSFLRLYALCNVAEFLGIFLVFMMSGQQKKLNEIKTEKNSSRNTNKKKRSKTNLYNIENEIEKSNKI